MIMNIHIEQISGHKNLINQLDKLNFAIKEGTNRTSGWTYCSSRPPAKFGRLSSLMRWKTASWCEGTQPLHQEVYMASTFRHQAVLVWGAARHLGADANLTNQPSQGHSWDREPRRRAVWWSLGEERRPGSSEHNGRRVAWGPRE
jgi:hypothetical protein